MLPIEGRAFDDVEDWYDRLPANVTTNVNGGVRGMKHHTAGMLFRFKTDSRNLHFRWTPRSAKLSMPKAFGDAVRRTLRLDGAN